MDKDLLQRGLDVRKAVLGKEYVEKAMQSADDFNRPFQEFISEYCWGAIWTREGLPRKTRSLLNLAMLTALNKPHELKLHIGGALTNGVTRAACLRWALPIFIISVKIILLSMVTSERGRWRRSYS